MGVEMKNSPYPNYSEKKLKQLKRNYAFFEKYSYFFAVCWAFIGIMQVCNQWLLERGFLLSGMMLTAYGVIVFGFVDKKRTFCWYKMLSQKKIEELLSRHLRYKRIGLLFGILDLVYVILWFLLGFVLHGRNVLDLLHHEPIWFYSGLLFWFPWFFYAGRVQVLNFIRQSRNTEEKM